ncbi:MAG: hypothetical protein DRP74_00180 [Candidatus Omnitrophota bacterium]|nr:MAG: hypothetical protein DRP74_00180 [Candidatus Omnitrophota bacterium]
MVIVEKRVKQILIVEDDKKMQDIYKIYFRDQAKKYKIEIVGSVEEATKRLAEGTFDLLILDIIMEPVPGDSLFVYVRSIKETRNMPIIVVSVLNPDNLWNLKAINGAKFIQKPVTKQRLLKEIKAVIG